MNGSLEQSKGSDEQGIKGHHVNNYTYTIGEELKYKLKAQNKYTSHAKMVLAKDKNKKSKNKNRNIVSINESLENLFDESNDF